MIIFFIPLFPQGFSSIPDQVSPIRQTPIPGVEHLDRVQEHLQAAKSNLEWAAHSFHRGLLSEAKTQEEILRVRSSNQNRRSNHVIIFYVSYSNLACLYYFTF